MKHSLKNFCESVWNLVDVVNKRLHGPKIIKVSKWKEVNKYEYKKKLNSFINPLCMCKRVTVDCLSVSAFTAQILISAIQVWTIESTRSLEGFVTRGFA